MKIQDLLDAPPIKITNDLADMERYIDVIDVWLIPDERQKDDNVEMRYYVEECFDGRRGLEIVSIWFKQKPVMLAFGAGRELRDSEGVAILDAKLYNELCRYVEGLKKEDTDDLNCVSLDTDFDSLGFNYGQNCTLHDFYTIDSVNPRFKKGDIVIARVPENHLTWDSVKVETRVKINTVRHHNPNNTYSGTQLDRRWGDGEQRHVMITDVGNGSMGAHFAEKDAIRLAD